MAELQQRGAELAARAAELEQEAADKAAEVQALETEKALQSAGEVKELAEAADALSKKLVKDTSAFTNKKEALEAEQANLKQARGGFAGL